MTLSLSLSNLCAFVLLALVPSYIVSCLTSSSAYVGALVRCVTADSWSHPRCNVEEYAPFFVSVSLLIHPTRPQLHSTPAPAAGPSRGAKQPQARATAVRRLSHRSLPSASNTTHPPRSSPPGASLGVAAWLAQRDGDTGPWRCHTLRCSLLSRGERRHQKGIHSHFISCGVQPCASERCASAVGGMGVSALL